MHDLLLLSKIEASYAVLYKDLTDYYGLIRDKNWRDAYRYHTQDFKNNIRLEMYCKDMAEDAIFWRFDSYEIKQTRIAGANKVRFIISFIDSTGENTAIVWWKKENNEWKCESVGPGVFTYSIPMGSAAEPTDP